jgi:hypothetical protein
MVDHLFTLALNTEELIEKARELSELSELNGIPTFSLDAILELINKNLIKNVNHENLQNLLASILGEASTDLTDAILAELNNSIDADPPDTNPSPNKSPFTISPYSYTGIVTEAVTTSLPTTEWFTTPFSSFALGTSPSFQVTVKFDIPDENTSIDEATKEILKSLDDVGGYSFDVKLELDLSNIACSASDSETLNTLIANNFIVALNPIGAMTLTYFNQQLTSDGQYAVLIEDPDDTKYPINNDLRYCQQRIDFYITLAKNLYPARKLFDTLVKDLSSAPTLIRDICPVKTSKSNWKFLRFQKERSRKYRR